MEPNTARDEQTRLYPIHGASSELEIRLTSERLRTGHRTIFYSLGSWDALAGPVLLAHGPVPPFAGATSLARASAALVRTWTEQLWTPDRSGEGRAMMDARVVMDNWHDDLEAR